MIDNKTSDERDVIAAIALVVAFGLSVTPQQIGAILAFVSAGLAFITRRLVSPVWCRLAPCHARGKYQYRREQHNAARAVLPRRYIRSPQQRLRVRLTGPTSKRPT